MPDPITAGVFLAWVGGKALDRGFDRGIDWLIDRARDNRGTRQAPWGDSPYAFDITVGNNLRIQSRTPVLLTLQEATNPSGGTIISLMLGETTRLSLPRGNFVSSAMIVDPQRTTGALPVLRGFGWSQLQVGQGASRLVIPTQSPTPRLLSDVGLRKPDGSPLFRVPQARQLPSATGPLVLPTTRRASNCRAATVINGYYCGNPLASGSTRLCTKHRLLLRLGTTIYDYDTRRQIYSD